MARIVGPGLGGLVVALAGTGVAFAVNSLSYLAVVVALLAMRNLRPYVPPEPCRPVSQEHQECALVRSPVAPGCGRVLRGARAEHRSRSTSTCCCRWWRGGRSTPTHDVFGLIAAVFGAGALCGALFLATLGKASLRLLLAGAGGFGVLELAPRSAARAPRRSAACSSDRHLLHALGYERARVLAARGARSTCADRRRASTTSRSWAARRSAACSPAG